MLLPESLSHADLEAHDPKGGKGPSHGRRWRCPLPECHGSRDRDLSVDETSGAWNCHSCKARGKLVEHRATTPTQRRSYHTQSRARAVASMFDLGITPAPKLGGTDMTWRSELRGLQKLQGTPGAHYLESRGIPAELAHNCGVRFSPSWAPRREGTPAYRAGAAVVFPLRDDSGRLVAANGRYIGAGATPKTRTGGDASRGVFEATTPRLDLVRMRPFDAPSLIFCEGPIDALSMALCGYPALAVAGCNLPPWIDAECVRKRVLLASDADERGNKAASTWKPTVLPFAAEVERMRPPCGKDWNDALLQVGAGPLAEYLGWYVLLTFKERAQHTLHGSDWLASWRALYEKG